MTFKPVDRGTHVSPVIYVRLNDEDRARMKAAAKHYGIKQADFLRQCITYALDHMEE